MQSPSPGAMPGSRLDVDTTTPVVVLKLDPNVFHHGALGVIRSLGRLGVPAYVVHEERFTPASASRYLRGGWLWRPDPADVERVCDGLRRLAERIGRPAVLIPTDDAGALFLAEHGQPLRRWFRFPGPQRDLPRRLADKYALFELCRELGVPCATATLATSSADAEEFVERVGLPVVAKLPRPWRTGHSRANTTRSTTVVRTRDELTRLFRSPGHGREPQLMLQEYLPGGPGHDWFFHGYCDAASTCRPAFTGVKERSYPAHAGLTSLGRSAVNDRLADQVTRLLGRLSYRGIMDLDLRWDARDDQYKLLDFNPRIGAQFRLLRDDAGVDVAIAAHLDLTGRPVPHGALVPGRGFLVENYDPLAAFGYWRRGELDLWTWGRSLRTVHELAWFARDDLRPFGLMCLRMCWRAVRRPFDRRPRRAVTAVTAVPRYRPGRAVAMGAGR